MVSQLCCHRPQAGRLFCGRKRSGRTCLSGTKNMVPCMTGKIQKKRIAVKVSKDTKGVYWQLLKSDFFMYLCYLETNCLKTLAHSTKMVHIIPTSTFHLKLVSESGEGSLQFTPDLLTLLQNDMIPHGIRTNDSFRRARFPPWFATQRNATTLTCQRVSPANESPSQRSPEPRSPPTEGILCICSVPGSWNFMGFMKIIPHITGYFFFIPYTRGLFDRMEMLWLLW